MCLVRFDRRVNGQLLRGRETGVPLVTGGNSFSQDRESDSFASDAVRSDKTPLESKRIRRIRGYCNVKLVRHVNLTTVTRVVILTAFYFVGGLLGKEASFLSGSVALVWPPAGIALAAILLFGYRFWPGVALGAVLFSFTNGVPLGFFTLATAIGNTMGAIVCAFLLKKMVAFENAMERTSDVTGYVAFACFLGTTVNAAFNVVGSAYGGTTAWEELFPTLLEWWVPNALAGLVVAPVILAWATPWSLGWNSRSIAEAALCAVGLVAGTLISFNSWFVYGIQNYPLAYLPFPFLVWGALRFGQRGATTGTALVSALAIHSLLDGRGPFVTTTERDSLMLIGSYIGIIAVTNLLLAAAAAERRRAEREMSESEKRFRAVVEDQTDLICRFKPDGKLTFVNDAYCRFHGKRHEVLLGANFLDTLSTEDIHIPLSFFSALPPEQPVVSFDHRLMSPEGVPVWQQYTVRRLFKEQGETLEFQAVIQDITHRKESEQAVLASERKYRSLVANIPDVVWTANAGKELVYVSDNALDLLGYRPAELLGATGRLWLDRIHPNDLARVEQAFEQFFTREKRFDVEYRVRRKDGQWIWLHNRATAIRLRDGVMCADGLFSDISKRKRAEEALCHTRDAAEAASRAKSQFLANMSHELRTPLNAIIGFSEILSDETFGALNQRQLKYTNNILTSGRHLLQLINDILDLSKVEAGRLELVRSTFDVAEALANVAGIIKGLANKKRITLEFEVAANVPALFADEAKFRQIMYNLLSNAIKFTPEGGRVAVKATRLTVQDGRPGLLNKVAAECLQVAVTDTGIGIQPQDHERIFFEFEQVDSSYGRQQQGSGLGLALTKRLVEIQGGRIWVESEGVENGGSTFTFQLPLQPPNAAAAQAKDGFSSDRAVRRPLVLVVTSDVRTQRAINDHLTDTGYRVAMAWNLEEMTKAITTKQPYAIAIDARLIQLTTPGKLSEVQAQIPARVPAVVFFADQNGRLEFCVFNGGPPTADIAKPRLIDVIQRGGKLTGKEIKTILIIEDEPAVLELLARTFVARGFQVLPACTCDLGLEFAAHYLPDAIILDVIMPDGNGTQVVERLRADPQTRSIPILIHTGAVLTEDERQHLAAHVHSITAKPETARLLASVDRLETLSEETVKLAALI